MGWYNVLSAWYCCIMRSYRRSLYTASIQFPWPLHVTCRCRDMPSSPHTSSLRWCSQYIPHVALLSSGESRPVVGVVGVVAHTCRVSEIAVCLSHLGRTARLLLPSRKAEAGVSVQSTAQIIPTEPHGSRRNRERCPYLICLFIQLDR